MAPVKWLDLDQGPNETWGQCERRVRGEHAAILRAAGQTWSEVAGAVGLSNPTAARTSAVRFGRPDVVACWPDGDTSETKLDRERRVRGERAAGLRAEGRTWVAIAAEVGMSDTGAAYGAARRFGRPEDVARWPGGPNA